MKKILISLVSDQTIPNVEFIKEKIEEVDHFQFVSTPAMERKREWIIAATGLEEESLLPSILVNPFSPNEIEEKLRENLDEENYYLVNVTGGTKIMSLVALEFFKNVNAQIFYLTGRGEYIKLHPGLSKSTYPLKIKISLEEYLIAYGFIIKKKSKPFGTVEQCSSLLHYFTNEFNKETDIPLLEILQKKRSKNISSIVNIDGLSDFLDRIQYTPLNSGKLSKYENRFLSGDWFEDHLYFFLIANFEVANDEIGLSWNVLKSDSENEFDVLLMRNNKLYLFECKTSVYLGEEGTETFIGETIYKSDSLRNKFGLFTQTTLVTLSDLENERLKRHVDRAEASRVKLIGRKEFETKETLKVALHKI